MTHSSYRPTVCLLYYMVVKFAVGYMEGNNVTRRNYSVEVSEIITCQDLNYEHQQCHITDSEIWACVKTKSLSINSSSCPTDRQNLSSKAKLDYLHLCGYYEICAFSNDEFSCDASYNCTLVGYGELECTDADQINIFNTSCTPSLLHCPYSDAQYSSINDCVAGKSLKDEFIGKQGLTTLKYFQAKRS